MKKRGLLPLLLCVCLSLSGCQEAPQEVKDNMEKYGENNQEKDTDLTYCSIDELRSAKLADVTFDYSNLDIESEVDFSDVESVYIPEMKYKEGYCNEENIQQYTSLFGIDPDKLEAYEDPEYGAGFRYDSAADQKLFYLFDTGYLQCVSGSEYDNFAADLEQCYDLTKDDISDVEVPLEDGTFPLEQLVQTAQSWVEENLPNPDMEYKITAAAIRTCPDEDGLKRVCLCAEYYYKGIPLNNYILQQATEDEEDSFSTMLCVLELEYTNSTFPTWFYTTHGMCDLINATELDQVVDFESALSIVKKTLSGFGRMPFSDVRLTYMIIRNAEGDFAGTSLTVRPVYIFLSPVSYDNDLGLTVAKDTWYTYYFAVDMETGEYYTNLDTSK
jgi:hypothetical protein